MDNIRVDYLTLKSGGGGGDSFSESQICFHEKQKSDYCFDVNKRYLFYKRYQNIWLKTAESGALLFVSFIPIYIFSLIWPFPSENTICNINNIFK